MISKLFKSLLVVLAGLVVLAVAGLAFLNTDAGRDWLSGYASVYAAQDVRIEGGVSLQLSPPGLRVDGVSAASPDPGQGGNRWLSIDTIGITLPGLAWPPSADAPLQVVASGVHFDARAYAALRRDEPGGAPTLPIPPFAIAARVDDARVVPLAENLPALRVDRLEADVDPDRGADALLEAALGERAVSARVDVALQANASARPLPARLDVSVDVAGLSLAMNGAVADLAHLEGFDLVLTAGGDFAQSAGVTTALTDQTVTGRLDGDWGALRFDVERLEASSDHGRLSIAGLVRQERERLVVERGSVEAETGDLSAFLDDFGVETPLDEPLRLRGEFSGSYDGVDIRTLDLALDDGAATLNAAGGVRRDAEGNIRLEEIEARLVTEDAARLVTAFGARSSRIGGPLSASVLARGPLERIALQNLAADLGDGAITVTGGGVVTAGDSLEMALALDARATDTSAVVRDLPMPEWFGASGEAAGTLDYRDGRFSLSALEATFDGPRGTARVGGNIDDLSNLTAPGLVVELDGAADAGGAIETLSADISLPSGLDAPGRLSLAGRLERGHVSFEAQIADPRTGRGIRGDFRFEADPQVIRGDGPGPEGATVLSGVMDIGDLEERRFEMNASLDGTGGTISYSGSVDRNFAGGGTLTVDSMNLNVLAALAGVRTDFPNVAQLEAAVSHDAGSLTLKQAEFFTGATQLLGGARLQWPQDGQAATRLTVNLRSPELYLADLGMDGEDDDASHYFSRTEMPLDALADLDMDITLDVGRVHTRAIDYRDLKLTGQSRGGVLRVSSRQQLLGGGQSDLTLRVDVRGERPQVTFKADLDGIDPGELHVVKEGEDRYSGDIDAQIDIAGAGRSVGEILGSANGHFLARINQAVLPNRKLNLLSADFLFETLRTVNPFVRQSDELDIECGVMGYVIRDGVAHADKTVVIKGRRLLLVAEGEVNLGTEKVAMVIRPKAQEGIGLNTSGLVKFIGIGGTLSNPEIRTDPKGLLMTGASIGAAFASGGMSLFLQNIFDRMTTGKGECERVEAVFRDRLAGSPVSRRAVAPDR